MKGGSGRRKEERGKGKVGEGGRKERGGGG